MLQFITNIPRQPQLKGQRGCFNGLASASAQCILGNSPSQNLFCLSISRLRGVRVYVFILLSATTINWSRLYADAENNVDMIQRVASPSPSALNCCTDVFFKHGQTLFRRPLMLLL